ncbi:MAG: RNA methyltransferase [Deltaproteobacteria bacterium]|nr:RNA methyltransferase [Deltaproteobacteria bacterium]
MNRKRIPVSESTLLDRICIVLVEPQTPGNVGMVCRAMKNMGLRQLRLVKGCRTDHSEARRFAVSARDLLDGAVRFESLEDALADIEISVATTRRIGKYRQETMEPSELVAKLREGSGTNRVALVFGREDNGLSTDELALCRWQATIPTSDEYGSLNLAQAVLLFCYEVSRGVVPGVIAPVREMATAGEMEDLYGHMEKTLLEIGFLDPTNPKHLMRTIRRILARAELDSREISVLRGMMSQMAWATDSSKRKELP